MKLFTTSVYINLNADEVTDTINRARTCAISNSQVVSLL